MTHSLKPGDRVRVRTNMTVPGHQPGDKGTVVNGPILRASGEPFYIVAMDKRGTDTGDTIFSADEIEVDV